MTSGNSSLRIGAGGARRKINNNIAGLTNNIINVTTDSNVHKV